MIYVVATIVAGFTLPRLEHTYLLSYDIKLSVSSAQAVLSSIASGMMALTGIVFSPAFVVVQFSATAYSPRPGIRLSHDPVLFRALGAFIATFCYAIATLCRVDREGSGKIPLFSAATVAGTLCCCRPDSSFRQWKTRTWRRFSRLRAVLDSS